MRKQTWITNEVCRQNVKPNNVRYADGVVLSLLLSRRFSLPCYRSTERPNAISSSRDRLLSRTSSRTTYPRKYVSRLSVPIRQSSSPTLRSRSRSLSLLFRTRSSRADDGSKSSATKRRSFQNGRVNDASVGSLFWPFPLCVSGNGNGLSGGDDAGGRASTAHAQSRRPGCANRLRNKPRRPLGLRGGCCGYQRRRR